MSVPTDIWSTSTEFDHVKALLADLMADEQASAYVGTIGRQSNWQC